MTQTTDIRPLLDDAPLQSFHIRVLVISLLLALVNGLDNQMLANTIPAMAEDWGVAPQSFSAALTAGLIGMMIGAALFGNLADRIGLRPVLILVTVIYGVMTLITPLAEDTTVLTIIRLVAGIGLGGLPSAITAMLTEYSPKTWRSSFGNWVLSGIPVGGFVGSILASTLMPQTGWQFIYLLSGGISLAFAALAFARLPEAPSALIRIREDQEKLRGYLGQITSDPVPEGTTLSVGGEGGTKTSVRQAFQDGRARMTVLFWLCAFVMLMGFYFLAFWTPTLLSLAGLPTSQAILGTAALNLGGVLCGLVVGKVADRFGGRRVLSGMFVLGAASLAMASFSTGSVPLLMFAIFLAGAAWIAGQALIVVVLAQNYPAQIRATTIGSTLAVGRLGAIISPMVASVPLALGWSAEAILLIPIIPALIAAGAILFARPTDPATSKH